MDRLVWFLYWPEPPTNHFFSNHFNFLTYWHSLSSLSLSLSFSVFKLFFLLFRLSKSFYPLVVFIKRTKGMPLTYRQVSTNNSFISLSRSRLFILWSRRSFVVIPFVFHWKFSFSFLYCISNLTTLMHTPTMSLWSTLSVAIRILSASLFLCVRVMDVTGPWFHLLLFISFSPIHISFVTFHSNPVYHSPNLFYYSLSIFHPYLFR